MTNAEFQSIAEYRDIESLNYYEHAIAAGADAQHVLASLAAMSRDHARTPMQWDSSPHGAFTVGTPWIAANPNLRDINVAAARANPDSVMHYYRRLIKLRKTERALMLGDFTLLLPDDPKLWVFVRTHGTTTFVTMANFSHEHVPVVLAHQWEWQNSELVIGNYGSPPQTDTELVLRPWEARVYRTPNNEHGREERDPPWRPLAGN
jgi:oligo-1,6-glucosidase